MEDRVYRMFGSAVRALREEKNVTQEDLAQRVNLSRTSITNIEKGRQRVLLHQMLEIASALDADPSTLVPPPSAKGDTLADRDDVAAIVEKLKAETSGA